MKCRWCGKEISKEYCDFDCRKAYFDHNDDEDKFKQSRKAKLIASVIVSIPLMVLFCGAGVTVMFFLLGFIIYTNPFPSAEMKKKMPLKAAVGKVKTNGVILILIGLPFLALTYTPFF